MKRQPLPKSRLVKSPFGKDGKDPEFHGTEKSTRPPKSRTQLQQTFGGKRGRPFRDPERLATRLLDVVVVLIIRFAMMHSLSSIDALFVECQLAIQKTTTQCSLPAMSGCTSMAEHWLHFGRVREAAIFESGLTGSGRSAPLDDPRQRAIPRRKFIRRHRAPHVCATPSWSSYDPPELQGCTLAEHARHIGCGIMERRSRRRAHVRGCHLGGQ